jgi:uncharacterized membrane protein YhhN
MLSILLITLSLSAAIAYGAGFVLGPPSPVRTGLKMAAVGALAVLAWQNTNHNALGLMVCAALALSAIGDGFLAGDPKRWLPLGLGSFLIAHILYVAVFWTLGEHGHWLSPLRIGLIAASILGAVGMLVWLWPHLGAMRAAVSVYIAAIVAMLATSILLPWQAWPIMVGALAFMASDAILSAELFRGTKLAGSERLTAYAIWGLYYGGQAAIAYGLLI